MTSSSAISPADAISLTVAIGTPKCSARPERIGTPALDNCCRVSSWTLPAFTIRSTASVALFILDESPPLAVMALPTFSSTPMACSPSTPAYARELAASWYALYSIGDPDATRFKPSSVLVAFSASPRSEEHTSELQSRGHLVCRLLLEKKNINENTLIFIKHTKNII